MPFEQFDKKMKDAADHHHPAYDEKAWTRMERLLDKHLPNKEDDRRRFIFFLLLFLLVGGGTWLFISKPWQGDKKIAATDPVSTNAAVVPENEKTNSAPFISGQAENNTSVSSQNNIILPGTNNDQPVYTIDHPLSRQATNTSLVQNTRGNKDNKDQLSFEVPNNTSIATRNNNDPNTKLTTDQPVPEKIAAMQDPVKATTELPATNKNEPAANVVKPVSTLTKEVIAENPDQKNVPGVAKTDTPDKKETTAKKQTDKNKKKNSLFFSLGTGPDLSFVGSGNSSQVKLLAGAGIGFTYKERFTLRTGFYSGRKVYSAKASDYKAPPEFYTYYPYLEKVDADCKVYEIPLLLSYNFGKKSNWFVSAGLSSFLMKEESYNYYYKYTPTGNTYTNRWTIKDKNSHYFSVGTLSAGYKHNIGKRVTVMAEPYVKIPFAGVGYGKVKLNSGGVLFTVGIKAF